MSGAGRTEWLAVDWGTSRLRVWGLDADDTVLWERHADAGMGTLSRSDYEPTLLALAGDMLPEDRPTPAIVCGMAGSRQGWAEAPYLAVPCPPPGIDQAVRVSTATARLQVWILPGVRQDTPPDVMRGEETQIAGFLQREPGFDGVLCLPGTHTKWARISAGEIVSFETYLTGELFSLLAGRSVLRHSVAQDGWDDAAFSEALDEAIARPQALAQRLFRIRAAALLEGLPPQAARARLSGLLIGAELASARPYWLGQRVAVIGAERPVAAYAAALETQGAMPESCAAEEMTLAGLRAAHAGLRERMP